MKNSGTNISLTPYDEILSLDASPIALPFGAIVEIPLAQLHSFKNHPFRVVDDEEMQKTADSIREYGVLMPGIVRPRPDGEYEIISGHRRKRGCEIAGRTTMPVIVRELDDDEATIIMVDSNLQRENILPSERAAAYQMKMEAIRRRAGRPSKENCDQVGHNYSGQRSIDIIAENAPDSRNQIQRFMLFSAFRSLCCVLFRYHTQIKDACFLLKLPIYVIWGCINLASPSSVKYGLKFDFIYKFTILLQFDFEHQKSPETQ